MRFTVVLIFSTILMLLGCSENHFEKKRVGNEIIDAVFINDTIIDGWAKFYDLSNNLIAKSYFEKGKKDGYGITYYKSGKTKDSLHYSNDLLNGDAYHYDEKGLLLYKTTNFYGINMGDHAFYVDGKVQEYYFDNFEKKQLVNAKYDSQSRCETLVFKAAPIISSDLIEKQSPALSLFLYFPHPPSLELFYKMGIMDAGRTKIKEIGLNTNRLFLDTILPALSKGLNYYVSVNYKNLSDDSTINVYFQKF